MQLPIHALLMSTNDEKVEAADLSGCCAEDNWDHEPAAAAENGVPNGVHESPKESTSLRDSSPRLSSRPTKQPAKAKVSCLGDMRIIDDVHAQLSSSPVQLRARPGESMVWWSSSLMLAWPQCMHVHASRPAFYVQCEPFRHLCSCSRNLLTGTCGHRAEGRTTERAAGAVPPAGQEVCGCKAAQACKQLCCIRGCAMACSCRQLTQQARCILASGKQ